MPVQPSRQDVEIPYGLHEDQLLLETSTLERHEEGKLRLEDLTRSLEGADDWSAEDLGRVMLSAGMLFQANANLLEEGSGDGDYWTVQDLLAASLETAIIWERG